MWRALVLVGVWAALAAPTPHYQRSRVSGGGSLLYSAPLTSSLHGGTFTRATASTCRVGGAATYTTLASGAVCQSATDGLRLASEVVNILGDSKALSAWTAVGATVTANDNNGPSGAKEAERIQFTGANQVVRKVQAGFTPFSDVAGSLWLRTHASGAACTVDLGTTTVLGGAYYGGLLTVGPAWDRYTIQTIADASGQVTYALSNYATLGHGTPSCTDLDAVDGQLEAVPEGNGPTCDTSGGAPAICDPETWTVPHHKRIKAAKGTLQFKFRATERASWEQSYDRAFLSIAGSTTWRLWWDESASEVVFSAGGTVAAARATWAPWTSHTITIGWRTGGTIYVQWDQDYPQYSLGAYTPPTFAAGGDIAMGGEIDGFYSNLKIWKTFKARKPTVTHYASLAGSLTPTVGVGTYTYTGPAWLCLNSTSDALVTKALNTPCYYSDAEDTTGPDGGLAGVRVSRAVTNQIRGGLEAAGAGATPIGWSTSGAGAPLTQVDTFEGTYSAVYTSNGGARYIYETDADTGVNAYSYWAKYSAGTIGELLGITYAAGSIRTLPMLAAGRGAWHRETHRQNVTLGSAVYLGNAPGFGAQPNGNVFTFDAASYVYDSNFHPPFCAGVPPVTCTAEALSRAMGTEMLAVAGTMRVLVTPMWGANWCGRHWGNASGLDAQVVWNAAGWRLYWDNTASAWTFTAGGQSVASAAQRFPPLSTHEIVITWLDGAPLLLQVDGQTVVSSAGNKAAAALNATSYFGTDSGGGSELAGWVGGIDIR